MLFTFTYYHRIIECSGLEGTIKIIFFQPICHGQCLLPSTQPGFSKPHPTWLWILSGIRKPQFLWSTCFSASNTTWCLPINGFLCVIQAIKGYLFAFYAQSFHLFKYITILLLMIEFRYLSHKIINAAAACHLWKSFSTSM